MVHSEARGRVGRALVRRPWSRSPGCRAQPPLVLDTRVGDVASTLYRQLGYQEAGRIPEFRPQWGRHPGRHPVLLQAALRPAPIGGLPYNQASPRAGLVPWGRGLPAWRGSLPLPVQPDPIGKGASMILEVAHLQIISRPGPAFRAGVRGGPAHHQCHAGLQRAPVATLIDRSPPLPAAGPVGGSRIIPRGFGARPSIPGVEGPAAPLLRPFPTVEHFRDATPISAAS